MDFSLIRQLFQRTKIISIKEPTGKVEFRENQGILIHPSGVPTVIEVDLRKLGKIGRVEFSGWISYLPPEAFDEKSGVVGVEIRSDDIILKKSRVTLSDNLNLTVDLESTASLKISVDDGNGTAGWDWFIFGATKK